MEMRSLREKKAIYCELLVLRCRQGRPDALEELIRTWERPLLYYVRRLLDSDEDARQVLQETWLKVFPGLGRLRCPERLPAWLYGIARNTAVRHLRGKRQERALFESDDGFALLALVGLWTTVVFAPYAFTGDPNDREGIAIYRILMIFAFFVSAAWTALTGWAAVSGTIRRMHRPWIVATTLTMGFCYLVTMMFVFVVPISHEESRAELGTQLALIWFFLLNTIGLCTILGVLYRGQFKSQEKLLEIEYRLAGLAEKLDDGKRIDRPVS